MQFAQTLEASLDTALSTYVTAVSQSMTGYAVSVSVALNTIYFTSAAYAAMRGDMEKPMSKVIKDFFAMALIGGVAFSFGNYQNYVIDGLRALQNDLTSVVSARSGNAQSVGQLLDYLFSGCLTPPGESECISFDAVLWKLALKNTNYFGMPDFTFMFASFILDFAQLAMLVFCVLPWLLAKVALAILLAIGPIFILCLMWPVTKKYFENWLSSAVGNVLTMVLIAAILSIIPTIFRQSVEDAFRGLLNSGEDVLGRMLTLLVIAIALGLSALHASQKGAQLAGGGVSMDGKGLGGMIVQGAINRMFMGRNNGGGGDKDKDKDTGTDQPNAVSRPSRVQRASESVGRAAGRQVSNMLDALSKKR